MTELRDATAGCLAPRWRSRRAESAILEAT
ncbi:MAG: hypothetical protein QOF96_2922, partial [Actinomycetota bacterium]|nr:hypothetical protein [Actinomycetota bacterium]